MRDFGQTILSQFANSPSILTLLASYNQSVDPRPDIDALYNLVINLQTAQGYGLDVWGRIVGVSRTVKLSAAGAFFGFNDGVDDYTPFNCSPFYAGVGSSNNYELSDAVFLQLILLKAAVNITGCGTPTLSALLTSLFGASGRCYVTDLGLMQMAYVFEFTLSPTQYAIFTQSGIAPRPTGVFTILLQGPPGQTFGFAEAGTYSAAPFNCGSFLDENATALPQT
jgi:uncharacterized protein DUF2612